MSSRSDLEKDAFIDLPRWLSRGNRRGLEEQWLRRLELSGLPEAGLELRSRGLPELKKAVDEFNNGLFWECHETLEDIWRETPYPQRFFYHAIIKATVGFHHLFRHNRHGARVKLSDAVRLLRLFQPSSNGLRTDIMLSETSAWLARVEAADRVAWAELDSLPAPVIQMVE